MKFVFENYRKPFLFCLKDNQKNIDNIVTHLFIHKMKGDCYFYIWCYKKE